MFNDVWGISYVIGGWLATSPAESKFSWRSIGKYLKSYIASPMIDRYKLNFKL